MTNWARVGMNAFLAVSPADRCPGHAGYGQTQALRPFPKKDVLHLSAYHEIFSRHHEAGDCTAALLQ